QSCCQTKVRHIELAPAPLRQCFVDLIEELNRVNVRRGSNAPDNDTSLLLLMLVMVDIGIAPATCAKLPHIFRMGIDDRIAGEVDISIGQLAGLMLRASEIITLVVPAKERCQMGKDWNLLIAISVMGNRCAIGEDDVAIVNSKVPIEHAADDPVAWTQPL